MNHRRLAPAFKRACRDFEKIEARYWRADAAYSEAADGVSLSALTKAFKKFRVVECDLFNAYVAMTKASKADTVAHFVYMQRVLAARRQKRGG